MQSPELSKTLHNVDNNHFFRTNSCNGKQTSSSNADKNGNVAKPNAELYIPTFSSTNPNFMATIKTNIPKQKSLCTTTKLSTATEHDTTPSISSTKSNPTRHTTQQLKMESKQPNYNLNYFSYINIQGLKPKTVLSKVPFINDVLTEKKQLFMCLSETWLNDHTEAELVIPNYKLFRTRQLKKENLKKR